MNKKRFFLYTDYRQHLDLLSLEQKGQLLDAIFAHASGEEVELSGVVEMAFSFISAQMDRDNENYEAVCEKRREAGSKGGQANASKNKQMLAKTTKINLIQPNESKSSKSKDIDIDIDIDKDIDTDKDKDKDKDKEKIKERYGENNRVTLTLDEYNKLVTEFGYEDTQAAIQLLDDYIVDKGYKSKSNYAAIRRWVIDAVRERKNKKAASGGTADDWFRERGFL